MIPQEYRSWEAEQPSRYPDPLSVECYRLNAKCRWELYHSVSHADSLEDSQRIIIGGVCQVFVNQCRVPKL